MKSDYATQLVCRAEDESGDMVFGAGEAGLIHGTRAMRQVLRTRLHAEAGEWWEGDDTAIPWHGEVLGAMIRQNRREEIDLMVVNRLMDTVNVTGVEDIRSSIVNRQYQFACTVNTVYGATTVEVSA